MTSTRRRRPSPGFASGGLKRPPATSWKVSSRSKRKNISVALEHFDDALKKDPENKIVQFWKAQLDSQTGSLPQATKVLEDLVKNRPSKEIDSGVTLMSAAQSALANLELQTGNLDDAIRRYEELKRNSETGKLSRADRWQLISAYVAKDQWPIAKRELAAILNDPKNPPSNDERVRGANVYRQRKEEARPSHSLTTC